MSVPKFITEPMDGKEREVGTPDKYLAPKTPSATMITPSRSRPGFPHRIQHCEPEPVDRNDDVTSIDPDVYDDDDQQKTDTIAHISPEAPETYDLSHNFDRKIWF